jgi:hypothetical protein
MLAAVFSGEIGRESIGQWRGSKRSLRSGLLVGKGLEFNGLDVHFAVKSRGSALGFN